MKNQELTEKQKFQCVVQWLNALYDAFRKEEKAIIPCGNCPHYVNGCDLNVPPPANFKVLEQFTGDDTVISVLIK